MWFTNHSNKMKDRFRGFLPVVIDVETGGVNPQTDALLEICAQFVEMDENGKLHLVHQWHAHIAPFKGANLDQKSLDFNKIDPFHPFRMAQAEDEALASLFQLVKKALKKNSCQRAVLVGHNSWFDLLFMKAAVERSNLNSPFHSFTSLDTASLSALLFGQTVLAKAMKSAKIEFDCNEAHSAIYDAQKTAELFCHMVNHLKSGT